MKKIGLLFKEISENRIRQRLKDSQGLVVINYSKLSGPDLNTLRLSLRKTEANLFMVKNSIARRSLKSLNLDSLVSSIEGPCALLFIKDKPIDTCRFVYDFAKEHEGLKIQGGCLEDRLLQGSDIKTIAGLPSEKVLITQMVLSLKLPISGLVMLLNQTLRKLIFCLRHIATAKQS